MGEGTVDVESREQPARLEHEVESIREDLSGIVSELDHRRRELLDWRMQLRKHALVLLAVGAGFLLAFGVTAALEVPRKRRRNRPLAKARRLRQALSRMVAHPELVAKPPPSVASKLLLAATSAATAALARTLIHRVSTAAESAD